jgi:hypothetical protein
MCFSAMSLAPSERRALDKIENSLRHSDPRLARMLARFTVPISRGGLMVMMRGPRRIKPLIVSVIALTAISLLVLAVLHSPGTVLPCSASSGSGFTTSTRPSCPSALQHKAHIPSTAETGISTLPTSQPTP